MINSNINIKTLVVLMLRSSQSYFGLQVRIHHLSRDSNILNVTMTGL
jgi:hypothetical protein